MDWLLKLVGLLIVLAVVLNHGMDTNLVQQAL